MRIFALVALLSAVVLSSACGGGTSKSATQTPGQPTSSSSAAASNTPRSGATTSASASAGTTAPSGGTTLTLAQATALLESSLLMPKDLPAGWQLASDMTQDNAAAVLADPRNAASNDRCGRLVGRTVTNQPADQVTAYLGGETVSFFSTGTVYATEAGAIDCATETAQRYAQPGELANVFKSVFANPAAVVVTPFAYPQVGDGSFAVTLSGDINAAGTTVALTILLVGFRQGNVTGAVGSAASGTPKAEELTPYVNLVLQRMQAAQ